MEKEIRCWLILVVLQLLWIGPCVYDATMNQPAEKNEIQSTEDVICQSFDEVANVTIKPLEFYEVAESEDVTFYDVPLSEELQLHIFEECEKYNIAPAIIIAMIDEESDFDANDIGDNGKSFGLMQIQPRWHAERMERLGCTDLFDPFQNVTVGIDYVAYLKDLNSDLYWVLMAYNGGEFYATRNIEAGTYSDYALEVTERAAELEREVEDATNR